MASAFDWSPGGCCCDVATWWYDIYQFDGRTPKNLIRSACAGKNDQPSSSIDGDQWFITPSTATTPTPRTFQLYGYGASLGTEQLWSLEQRNESYYAVLYDCVAKSQVSITPVTAFGSSTTPFPRIYSQFPAPSPFTPFFTGIVNSVAASPTAFATVSSGGLEIVSGGSVTKQTNISPSTVSVNFGPGFYNDVFDNPHVLAPRSWPRVAGVSTRQYSVLTNGSQSSSISLTYTTKFTVGDLIVVDSAGDKTFRISNQIWNLDLSFSLQIAAHESTEAPRTSNPRWMYFDANGDNWIGVIQWETFIKIPLSGTISWRQASHIALVINGTIIKQYDDCAAFTAGTDTFIPNGPWSSVHAMFNGYLAVVAQEYAVEPGPSFPAGQLQQPRHTRLRIYNGSQLVWESPPATGAVTCHSSDRWLYAQLSGMDFHDMPRCAFTSDIPRVGHTLNVRNHWLIRPDGMACSPMGVRESEGTTVLPPELDTGIFAQHSLMYSPALGFETIKNSDLIPDVPPAEPF